MEIFSLGEQSSLVYIFLLEDKSGKKMVPLFPFSDIKTSSWLCRLLMLLLHLWNVTSGFIREFKCAAQLPVLEKHFANS